MQKIDPDRPGRCYHDDAVKVMAHPIRASILRLLARGPLTSSGLARHFSSSRYNLYHHLNVLEEYGLVGHRGGKGRAKEFFLVESDRPKNLVMDYNWKDLADHADELADLLARVESMRGSPVPNKERLRRMRIILEYEGGESVREGAE